MLAGKKRRPLTWQLALLLLIFGVVVGYPSCVRMSHEMWGGDVSRYHDLYVLGSFAGAVTFLAGFASFLAIAARAVSSPTGLESAIATPPPAAAISRFHVTLAAVVALAYVVIVQRHWGRFPLTSSYGRSFWLSAALTILLSQLPYAVALVRTWKIADRAGLTLAMVAGAAQVLAAALPDLRYTAARLDPWPWLSALLGLAVVVFAYLAWPSFPSRKGADGLLISIIFGFLAYTVLARVALAILAARELVP
jgi:hypothetical protein